jgi:hypothetical protein
MVPNIVLSFLLTLLTLRPATRGPYRAVDLGSIPVGIVIAVCEPRRLPEASDCAEHDRIMRPVAGPHIVELADGDSRFLQSMSGRGQ